MLPFKLISDQPRIVVFRDFLAPEEVANLIQRSEETSRDSTTVDGNGNAVVTQYRSGKITDLSIESTKDILNRLGEQTYTNIKQAEGFQVIRYGLGNEYREHSDWFDPRLPGVRKLFRKGGQRIFSVVIGLKEAEEGGELSFKELGIKFKIKVGDAIVFQNTKPSGIPDSRTVHAALPVTKGEKIVAVTWIRERAFDGSEEPDDALFFRQEQKSIKAMRQDACATDLPKFLAHYGCVIVADSVPVIGGDGTVTVETKVNVKALDLKEE